MARLDRLGSAKTVAQYGAVIGRQFSYDLLHAVARHDDVTLQHELGRLVESELLYQRGLPPAAIYTFKHALIQDVAYQSLLKSTRQRYHQAIAQALVERFPETTATQPELLAHHYTEAGLNEQAVLYWSRAGERAHMRSADLEAISHLRKGLDAFATLPDTAERDRHELSLQTMLGQTLKDTQGYGATEVARVYTRVRELCQQSPESPELFRALLGQSIYCIARAELQSAYELGERLLEFAKLDRDPVFLVEAYYALGVSAFWLGKFVPAREYLMQGWTDAQQGPTTDGIAQIQQGLIELHKTGTLQLDPYFFGILAELYRDTGQIQEGLRALDTAMVSVDQHGARYYEAELYRLKGELLLNAESTPEACFHQALDIARQQEAKSWELRTATSLASLWASAGTPMTCLRRCMVGLRRGSIRRI